MTKQNLSRSADLRLTWGGPKENTDHAPSTSTYSPDAATSQDIPVCATCDKAYFGAACQTCATAPAPEPVRYDPGVLEITPREDAPAVGDGATAVRQVIWPTVAPGESLPTFSALLGGAGCGKTYAVRELAAELPGVELVATTGIAAINIGGTTVNSLLQYFDTKSLQEKWMQGSLRATLGRLWRRGVQLIALDEVSMMDGDQLTFLKQAIDETNDTQAVMKSKADREWEEAFGKPHLKLLLVGDFAQLPPVKAPFAFESPEWAAFEGSTTTLTQVRRQSDAEFIRALRAARVGDAGTVVDYFAAGLKPETDPGFVGTTLLAKNESVDKYNWLRLSKLTTPEIVFSSRRDGELRPEWGGPPKASKDWGIPERLVLKPGALVMILANKKYPGSNEMIYVNGDLGEVVEVGEAYQQQPSAKGAVVPTHPWPRVFVRLQRTGQIVEVGYIRREKLQPCDSGRRTELRTLGLTDRIREDGKAECVGWIEYLPLRVAYATTVHKCCTDDTRVPVLTKGLVPMGELGVGDATPYGRIVAVARTRRETFRVRTVRGYTVTCSSDHRWMTTRGLVETHQLELTDRLELAQVQALSGGALVGDLAWLLGALVGDGYYAAPDHHVEFTNNDKGLRDAVAAEFRAHGCDIQKTAGNRVRVQKREFRQYLQRLGLSYTKAHDKHVPEAIFRGGTDVWAAFLSGLYDADGSVSRKRVCLTTVSERLATEVQLLLLYLGVPTKRTRFTSGYKGRGESYWQVNIAPAYMTKFFRAVRLRAAHKADAQTAFSTWTFNRRLQPFDGFDTIATIEDLNVVSDMIDIELEAAPHLCAFGPFVGHNSQGLSLDQVQVTLGDHFFKTSGMLYVALSRCRTPQGLRIVGSPTMLAERCTVHPKLIGRFL